jgi:hypothetical protein
LNRLWLFRKCRCLSKILNNIRLKNLTGRIPYTVCCPVCDVWIYIISCLALLLQLN